jgi:type II secretory pathway predicted ATPase ExeA
VYEAHFGLKQRPFSETVSPAAYVALPSRDAALNRLRYALERGPGPAVLYGPPGSGKTLLAHRLTSELRSTAVYVTFPALSVTELVAHVAEELTGRATPSGSLLDALRQLRDHLATAAARHDRPIIIVDDAHLIDSVATFETLRLLLNFTTDGAPDLSLLFVGGGEVLLKLPPRLSDGLTARCLLGTLTEAESTAYILGRLAATAARSPLFSPAALQAMHEESGGLPRRLNHLADMALLIAYARELPLVDELVVNSAAREFSQDIAA